jgi:uncharacterized SAM-binding protein YcdF (DUF218 family)
MKEFFLPLTEPIGAVWAVMAAGVIWLLCKRQWKAALWLGSPTVLVFVLGSTPLIEGIVGREEGGMDNRPRTTDNRQQTTDHGLQTADHGLQTTDHGPQTTNDGQQTTDHGQQTVEQGKPTGDENPRSTVSGLRSPVPSQGSPVPSDGSTVPPGEAAVGGAQPVVGSPSSVVRSPLSVVPSASPDAVLVLGGGVRMSESDRFGFAPSDAFARIFSGIELVREGQAKTLVLGGSYPYPGKLEQPSMVAVRDWIAQWGLTTAAVTNLGICYNTHDEALAFKSLYESQGWKSVILVTSALHMKRSVALFRKLGIPVEPSPADFEVYGVSQDSHFSIFPRLHRFRLWTLYLHERIGWWVYAMKGWV